MFDYEDLILARQDANEDYDAEAVEHENKRLEEVYPFLFHQKNLPRRF